MTEQTVKKGYSAVGAFDIGSGSPLESTVISCSLDGIRDESTGETPLVSLKPRWDSATRELWLGDWLIKKLKKKSESQETILDVFEELGWPRQVDDPLPPKPFQIHADRVKEACKRLNRSQVNELLYFHASPDREIIMWKVRDDGPTDPRGQRRPR